MIALPGTLFLSVRKRTLRDGLNGCALQTGALPYAAAIATRVTAKEPASAMRFQ
jgi:hypothetical protein